MAGEMLRFVTVGQQRPEKRPAAERRGDFGEIVGCLAPERAAVQAGRCSQCGVPYCHLHCPLHNNIPDWLRLTAEGRLEEAYELAAATNTLPEICGRICPQDRLCEGNCVIEQSRHGSVTIGAVEKFITDAAFERGWVRPVTPARERRQSVGIIGGGPAGLAAAMSLRARGYRVDIYDRHDRMGGLLVYGIPGFKLDKAVVARRIAWVEASGVRLHTGVEVGTTVTLAELRARHDAVLIATGTYQARVLKAPGCGLGGVVQALDYLIASNKVGLGDRVPAFEDGRLSAAGRNVVVIGGGDTAMDCVRTAVRQGAKAVRCLYRRDRANMPGSQREVINAEEEGVEFLWQAAPEAFLGQGLGQGQVRAVRAVRMHLGVADLTGRRAPQAIVGSAFTVEAEMVITALGFDPEPLARRFDAPGLVVGGDGTVRVEAGSKATSLDGVFAAGDIVRGASLVVWAIRDGRDAAEGIHAYLVRKASFGELVAA